jgi:putative hydrolase of the HAD superfamily
VIRAVFFDLDGTLYDRDALVTELIAGQYDAFAGALPGVSREAFVSRVLAMDDHGDGEKEHGYQRVVAEWHGEPALASRLCAHFWSEYDRHCRLAEDTATTLDVLAAHSLRLGVITNGGTERQRRKLAVLGILDRFDAVLVSEAERVRKPSAEILRRALERCGVSAAETFFVGDHPVADIAGARSAGLLPTWKRVPYWPLLETVVLTVHRLVEILPICLPE